MFFLHLAHFHLSKSSPLYERLSKQFKKFFPSTEAKKNKRQLQLSRLKLSYFNGDLQIAMRD